MVMDYVMFVVCSPKPEAVCREQRAAVVNSLAENLLLVRGLR